MKYSASFKLQVVKFASDNSNNSKEMVERSFKKCGISNALDGTEDDLVWEEEEDSSQVEEEPDCNVYDDRITPEQWQELFGESDDEEEFHGF